MNERKSDRSRVLLGIIIISIGILFVLNSFGYLSWYVWRSILNLWPLILIVIGLNIIFKKTKLWWLVPLSFIILFTGLLFINFSGYNSNIFFNNNLHNYSREVKYENDFKSLSFDIFYGAGRLDLKEENNDDNLCTFKADYNRFKPEIKYNRDNKNGFILIKSTGKQKNISVLNEWDLKIAREIPINIDIAAGAGSINLDLEKLTVDNLSISAGVSELEIKFNDYSTETDIKAGASNIKLKVPQNCGLRIDTQNVINNNNFSEEGLIRLSNNRYQSRNFGETQNTLYIDISSSASNINLDYD